MKPWPGGGFAPAKPVAGGRGEVTLAGKGRGGSNAFLGGALGHKKQQALVIFTWPGGSTSRTIKGNMTIRYVMEWCAAFNAECERLGSRSASGVGENVTLTERAERDGNKTTEEAHRAPDNADVSDEVVERDPEVRRRLQAHRALMTNPHGEPPDKWTAQFGESLEALWAAREAARTRLGTKNQTDSLLVRIERVRGLGDVRPLWFLYGGGGQFLRGAAAVRMSRPSVRAAMASGTAGACGAATAGTSVAEVAPRRRRRGPGPLVPPAG